MLQWKLKRKIALQNKENKWHFEVTYVQVKPKQTTAYEQSYLVESRRVFTGGMLPAPWLMTDKCPLTLNPSATHCLYFRRDVAELNSHVKNFFRTKNSKKKDTFKINVIENVETQKCSPISKWNCYYSDKTEKQKHS